MPHGLQDLDSIGIEVWLNPQLIAGVLEDTRLVGGFFDIEVEIDDVDNHLHHGVDDRAASGRAGDEPRLPVFHNNCRHHRGKHPFARRHRIGRWRQTFAERFGSLCVREVIHLIVEQHPSSSDHHARTKIGAQSVGC